MCQVSRRVSRPIIFGHALWFDWSTNSDRPIKSEIVPEISVPATRQWPNVFRVFSEHRTVLFVCSLLLLSWWVCCLASLCMLVLCLASLCLLVLCCCRWFCCCSCCCCLMLTFFFRWQWRWLWYALVGGSDFWCHCCCPGCCCCFGCCFSKLLLHLLTFFFFFSRVCRWVIFFVL